MVVVVVVVVADVVVAVVVVVVLMGTYTMSRDQWAGLWLIDRRTSGAMSDLPISSQMNAYSTLLRPAPYTESGSMSRARNKFHRPSDLASA